MEINKLKVLASLNSAKRFENISQISGEIYANPFSSGLNQTEEKEYLFALYFTFEDQVYLQNLCCMITSLRFMKTLIFSSFIILLYVILNLH